MYMYFNVYSYVRVYSVTFCVYMCRYLRILQTRGKKNFTLHLDSCSYVDPVPYKFRYRGLMGNIVHVCSVNNFIGNWQLVIKKSLLAKYILLIRLYI